jgi:hypothetical protein
LGFLLPSSTQLIAYLKGNGLPLNNPFFLAGEPCLIKELLLGVTPFWFWDKSFLETSGLAAAPTQPQTAKIFSLTKKKALLLAIGLC